MRIFSFVLGAAALATAAIAQDDAPPPEPTVSPLAIAFSPEGLSGPAAETLRADMADAQFVMVGEAHGYAGPPLFTAALGAEGSRLGIDTLAVEVGPISTAWIAGILREGGSDALAAQLDGRPLAVPFLNLREDADMATRFALADKLWGIDQEFIGSTLVHLAWLQERARDDDTRMLVTRWLEAEREAFATGDQGAVMMMRASAKDWDQLGEAFAHDPLARERIGALAESGAIYRLFLAGKGLDNNLDRIALMKRTFLDRYHAAHEATGKPPRVLMKLGALHAGRGTSDMNTFDIGSLVPGMAAANAMTSLHIAYLPLGGTKTAIAPSADGFFGTSDGTDEEFEAVLAKGGVDVAAIDEGHWLVALEPVRRTLGSKGLGELDRGTRFMLLGYDYLVTTRGATPATPLALR